MSESTTFTSYVDRTNEIRRLSTPSLEGIQNPDAYSTRLRENFTRIGNLASLNRPLLEEHLYPLLKSEGILSDEPRADITSLYDKLISIYDNENVDAFVSLLITERLLGDAQARGELPNLVAQMDRQMDVCYTLLNMTDRIHTHPEIAAHYRSMGMEIGRFFRSLREPENFEQLPDESTRATVLTDARYALVFFEGLRGEEVYQRNLAMFEDALKVAEDPFYHRLVPNFDWDYYRFRTLQYYAYTTDYHNYRGLDAKALSMVCDRTEELVKLYYSFGEEAKALENESLVQLTITRNRYLTGRISWEECLDSYIRVYESRDHTSYEINNIGSNLLVPTEILCLLRERHLSEKSKTLLEEIYQNVLDYTFRMPNNGTLSFFLEYVSNFMERFIEVPGLPTFEKMLLDLLAALHPPTYVHSKMVAQIAVCLCGHLLDYRPELFCGVLECGDVQEVLQRRDAILSYTYHAALCHDAGKVSIIDTVFVYGRRLLDMEFDLIKTHPNMGARVLLNYESTAAYADVARGHHRWYDNSRGYPEDFDTSTSPVKVIIDLVACADCLDAATDTVGRSYNQGKTLADFVQELKEGAGTRYAPWLVDLFAQEIVSLDIEYLLSTKRDHTYRNAFNLLRGMRTKEGSAQGPTPRR